MDEEMTIKDFSQYRLNKAKETLNGAEILYDNKNYGGAINRAYYSIFYAMKAVLTLEKKDFKRHKDVVGYFNKNYVHTEIFPKIMGKKIAQSKKIREDSDYDDEYEPFSEEVQIQIETAKELIELVEKYLKEKTV